jgi:type IX secretion system PorP/SprF family membrane protein
MNKTYLTILFIISFCTFSSAQQVPFYNHNIINPFVYNPAMVGYSGDMNAYVVRNQRYMGYGTGAISNMLTLEGNFIIPNSGFGMILNQSSIGIMQQVSAKLSYSYHLKINESHNLRLGLSVGYLDNRINTSEIDVSQLDDPFLVGLRPNVGSYDFNFGALYSFQNDTRIGFSVPQLIGNKVKYSKENSRGYYSLARHFMLSAEHDFRFFADESIILKPQVLARYIPGAPFQYDITAHLDYKNLGWFSATYKSDYAVQFNLGFHIKENIHVGYSYEYIVGSFRNYYSGFNHEFLLGYTFKTGKSKEIEVMIPDPEVVEENKRLSQEIEDKEREIEKKDSLFEEEVEIRVEEELRKRLAELEKEQQRKQEEVDNEPITKKALFSLREAEGHYFEEVDGSDSPNGYYTVVGVYDDDENTDKNLTIAKNIFPDAYIIINKANDYDYIVIEHSMDRGEAFDALYKYRDKIGKNVWILRYSNYVDRSPR